MENYFLKIIQLFGHSSSRILIISTNDDHYNVCLKNCPEKLISHVNPKQHNAISLLSDYIQKENYGLIILDRIWDNKDRISEKSPLSLNGDKLWKLINQNFSPNGQIICLAENKLNLRAPVACMKSLFNFLLRGDKSLFSRYYSNRIKKTGCSHVKRFHLIPSLENFNHLISDNRRATLEFMRKSRSFSRVFPKNPIDWPKWIFVWLGVDGWLVSTHLFWGIK